MCISAAYDPLLGNCRNLSSTRYKNIIQFDFSSIVVFDSYGQIIGYHLERMESWQKTKFF